MLIFRNQVKNGDIKVKEEKEEVTDDKIEVAIDDRVYTRDVLLVTGLLDGEEVNLMVNHWPSRSGGEKKAAPLEKLLVV